MRGGRGWDAVVFFRRLDKKHWLGVEEVSTVPGAQWEWRLESDALQTIAEGHAASAHQAKVAANRAAAKQGLLKNGSGLPRRGSR